MTRGRLGWACAGTAVLALVVSPACRNVGGRAADRAAVNPDEVTVPHADHDPRHGGLVLMHGDLHYEVVLKPEGRYQVYFSDARRAPLPATVASEATITIMRKAEPDEVVALQIAGDGESWIGGGKSVQEPEATARVAYEIDGKTYWIDLPFGASAAQPAITVPDF